MLESIISNEDAMNYPKGQAIDPVSIDMHQKSCFRRGIHRVYSLNVLISFIFLYKNKLNLN